MEGAGFSGRIQDFPLRDVLRMICLSSRTGSLRLRGRGANGRIDFENGQIIRASTSLGYSNLGDLLVLSGRLSREDLARVVQRQRQTAEGTPLGALMVQEGLITRADLQDVLRRQVQEVVLQLLEWTEGTVTFQATLSPAVDDIALGTSEVLLAAAISTSSLLKEIDGPTPRVLYAVRGGRPGPAGEAIAARHAPLAILDLEHPRPVAAPRTGTPTTLIVDLSASGRRAADDASRAVGLIAAVAPDRVAVLHGGLPPAARRALDTAGARIFIDLRAGRALPRVEVAGADAATAIAAATRALDDLKPAATVLEEEPVRRRRSSGGRS